MLPGLPNLTVSCTGRHVTCMVNFGIIVGTALSELIGNLGLIQSFVPLKLFLFYVLDGRRSRGPYNFNPPLFVAYTRTPCLRKILCQCYFWISAKYWPTSMIIGMQHLI